MHHDWKPRRTLNNRGVLLMVGLLLAMCAFALGIKELLASEAAPFTLMDAAPDAHYDSTAPRPYDEGTAFEKGDLDIDFDALWEESTDGESLRFRMVRGIMRSRTVKGTKNKIRWERCGEVVAQEDLTREGILWVETILEGIEAIHRESGVRLNPWGAYATIANESSFNECSLDLSSRKFAVEKGLVKKFRLTYDRDTVWSIVTSQEWKDANRRKADFGPWQLRKRAGRLSRSKFDDLLSIHPGVYKGLQELKRRARAYQKRFKLDWYHPRPWKLWPGALAPAKRLDAYDRQITKVARWLGARKDEIEPGFAPTYR